MAAFEELVWRQINMLEAGQMLEAIDHFFADYGVIYSNGHVFGEGLTDCRLKQEQFVADTTSVTTKIADLFIDPHSEFCVFRNRTGFEDAKGKHRQVDGLHVQMWAQGKIASEWRYSGEPMRGMIGRGLLKDPAHILELVGS